MVFKDDSFESEGGWEMANDYFDDQIIVLDENDYGNFVDGKYL